MYVPTFLTADNAHSWSTVVVECVDVWVPAWSWLNVCVCRTVCVVVMKLQSDYFQFVNGPDRGRYRAWFYKCLGRLVFLADSCERLEVSSLPVFTVV